LRLRTGCSTKFQDSQAQSALGGKAGFERASLPAPRQLALHVDADAFLDLVNAG